MVASRTRLGLVACVALIALGGCGGGDHDKGKTVTIEPGNPLSPGPTGNGTAGRILECTKEAADGSCLVRTCKKGHDPESPPGAEDCASYAAACINKGLYWEGTKEAGLCKVVDS
jgi:hypothetical protein